MIIRLCVFLAKDRQKPIDVFPDSVSVAYRY